MPWELQQNSGTRQSLSAWGLRGARLTFASLDEDVLEFAHEGASFTGTPIFAEGDCLHLFWVDDEDVSTQVFEGYVRGISPLGSPRAERISYRVCNVWEWFKHVVFQQQWKVADDTGDPDSALSDAFMSRCTLGISNIGDFQNIGQVVTEILDFAISTAGLPVAFAGFAETIVVPAQEIRDLTIAGTLLRILKWIPDVASWLDYSTSPPTLHLARFADLSSRTLAVPGARTAVADCADRIEGVELNPRYDLQIPAVLLRYMFAGENDNGWNTVTVDKYPTDCTGFERAALVQTLDLMPGQAEIALRQSVIAEPLPGLEGATPNGAGIVVVDSAFLADDDVVGADHHFKTAALALATRNFPILRKKKPDGSTIVSDLILTALAYRTTDGSAIDADCVNELIDGAVTPWMKDQGVKTQEIEIGINFTFTNSLTSKKWIITGWRKVVRATSAVTQSYKFVTSPLVVAESAPDGLAEQLYDSMNILAWSGRVSLLERECSFGLRPGQKLNFSGGPTAWASAGAVVQKVLMELDTGATSAQIGPPDHLSAQDLIERQRLGRNRTALYLGVVAARLEGIDTARGESPELATEHPHKPSAHNGPEFSENGDDYTGPDEAHELKPTEMLVCVDDGVGGTTQKKMMVHATDAYAAS